LEKKSCFKRSLKKKKKETLPSHLSAQAAQQPASLSPRRPTPSLSFSFSLLSLTPGLHLSVSPSPLPFFFLTSQLVDPVPPRKSRRAPPLPFPPSSPSLPIKAINPSLDQLGPLLP
jgi:hypothetical protein